ncbi:phosphotransferase family protein [Streptomyces sp. NPDC005227]|uniref:phosphotransferase family protein n=1 Tax=Streptomyces sp. NPDC005227 TaxID=3364707 RepID=UPI0036946653
MPARTASPALLRAVAVSGDADAVEGPLHGYHHETYVFPLPGGTEAAGQVRWKCREPRPDLLWFDRRCFASEEQLLRSLAGRIEGIPELIEAGSTRLQRFVEGHTLGRLYGSGTEVPESLVRQVISLFRQLAAVRPGSLTAERTCEPADRAPEADSSGFLERLLLFTEKRVYRQNLPRFAGLFGDLGLDDGSFKKLRKRVSGLTERPFCLLHADLHRENFVVDPENRLWTIDWELAMFGDPLYDLATHLYLMRYPADQERHVVRRWREAVDGVAPGSSAGYADDLPKLLAYKRAQSVFTDVIRTALTLDPGPVTDREPLVRAGRRIEKVLIAAEGPLEIERMPSTAGIALALEKWCRNA